MISMKKHIFKIFSSLSLIIDAILFFPDLILYVSWKNGVNFYKYFPFLKYKSFLNSEDFIDSATVIILNWYWVAYILFFVILLLSVIDIIKIKSKASIILGLLMLAISFFILYTVYRHHSIIEFYFSPSNDLPWNYREFYVKI